MFVWFSVVYIVALSVAQYLLIEASANNISGILSVDAKYIVSGIATICAFNVFMTLITKRLNIALSISAVLMSVLPVVNFYVYKYHGTPFNVDLLGNISTALNVASAYSFDINLYIKVIVAFAVVQLLAANILFNKTAYKRRCTAIPAVFLSAVMFFVYFSSAPVVEKDIVNWSWDESIMIAGYTPCLVQSTQQSFNAIQKPEGYSEADLKSFVENYTKKENGNATPDIILVLNETFYDLNQIADTEETQDSFEYVKELDNSVSGYAVVPSVIGGTNKSEYEYLTSNSLKITSNITPFNTINMNNTNSVVSFLKNQGYRTLAAHPSSERNYRRNVVYADMGFDALRFEQHFTDIETFASRPFINDDVVYKNMFRWYEEMGDQPRFIYALTIQNHAGYKFNSDEENIVKASNDFGEYDKEVDEFMTCMYVSSNAFSEIVEYFSSVERDVIVCMVGDHAPSFAVDIVDEKYQSEKELRLRSVPYVIWSNNIDLSNQEEEPLTSLTNLVPKTLEMAGMNISGYYDFINQYSKEVPVITTYGDYVTRDGKVYSYDENTPYTDIVNRYMELNYANMQRKDFMKQFGQ